MAPARSASPKSVAIMSKPAKPELARILPELLQWLKQHNYQVVLDMESAEYAQGPEVLAREAVGNRVLDFVIVLGGDGTLLSAARVVAKSGIPILGINLGTLGFLTEVPLAEVYDSLEAVDQNRCRIDSRSLIHSQLVRGEDCIANFESLNDVIVSKAAIARLATFELHIDQMFVSSYKADGLIISTPTGSTAYSMAAGGPILTPSVEAFVVTPVSPHSLTHRVLVVRDSSEIVIAVKTGDEQAFLSIDGQLGIPALDGDRVVCRKSEHKVRLFQVKRSFFEVLRTKLKWGQV
jgi:NAD+ kinase